MTFSKMSPEEKFLHGKEAIERGDLDYGLNAIMAAAYEGCPEAQVVNAIVWKRKKLERSKAYKALQKLMLNWMQSDDSPLNPESKYRVQVEEGAQK